MKSSNPLPGKRNLILANESLEIKPRRVVLMLLLIANLAALPVSAKAQSAAFSDDPSSSSSASTAALPASPTYPPPDRTYTRPTEKIKIHNYLFDAFGPYPIVGSAIAAGINQEDNSPPEWRQGMEGYGKRIGSDFVIAAITTTTRYGLAEAIREDTLYYRCQCKGALPRLGHAVISTLTSRRGNDGHRVFSFSALVAPYAGTMTAVYGWYPRRYDAMDGFRMGNYNLLAYVANNIALEFIYSGPHSWISRMHLNNTHGAPTPGANP
jgi:hypothetical protein